MMTHFVKSFCFFGLLLFAGLSLNAQQLKIGYINSAELIELMPETKKVDSQLTKFAQGLEEHLETMQKEFDGKLTDYRENQQTLSDSAREVKEQELQDLNQRIQQFQVKSQQDYVKKQNELMAPILKKAEDAIKAVSAAGKYTYVFDTSNTGLIVKPEGDNMLPLVKQELGL